jgi:uracil-DNA glycosylase family 4
VVERKNPSAAGKDPILKAVDYPTFRDALRRSKCRRCGLAAARTSIVVDRGSPSARVVLIGEGPGAEEDRQGLAFVGRSGKVLDSMLAEAGLDPARDVLIANVVKCRPPGNRPPSREEAAACLPFLRRQIELVAPRVMVLLGRTAAKHLLPGDDVGKLSSMAGRFLARPEWPGIDILVTYHPAYVLRNPRRRPEMVGHLAIVAKKMVDLVRESIPFN